MRRKLKKLKQKIINADNYLKKRIHYIFFLIFIGVYLYGQFIFFAGFHNLDVNQNLEKLTLIQELDYKNNNVPYEYEFYESDLNGNLVEFAEGYRLGLKQILSGLFIIMISCLFIGYNFCNIIKDARGNRWN